MDEVKWIDWPETVRLLKLAGVGHYREPRSWAASGLVSTKAEVITIGGESFRDREIPIEIWRGAQQKSGAFFDAISPMGKIAARTTQGEAHFLGLSFDETALLKLLPRVPSEEDRLKARLADLEGDGSLPDEMYPDRNEEEGAPPPKKSSAGRKADGERWANFYFCVVELAKDGRLTPEHFPSQGSLNEELALMMGDNAFNTDHVKGRVAQIYKRFVEG